MSFFHRRDGSGTRFKIHLTPRSSKEKVGGEYGDALKVYVKAPPVDGRANEALLKFLAKRLGVPTSAVSLVSGQTSRTKVLRVDGLEPDETARRLTGS